MIYVSKRPTWVTDQIIIDEIVLPSGLKNRRQNITGCLWFSKDRFLQILEGPRTAVLDIFNEILKDDRHEEISTLSSTPLATRSFSRWGMRVLTGVEPCGIDELITRYAPKQQVVLPTKPQPEPILEQIRSYLVRLAQVDPVMD